MKNPTASPLEQVLALHPAEILTWLQSTNAPEDFNRLGLAEAAAQEAIHADSHTALSWARVAIDLRNRIAATARDEALRHSQTVSAMMLRAATIDRYGSVAGDPIRDCDLIYRWFLDRHVGQIDITAADARRWRDLPVERIRELRRIKNELAVLSNLQGCVDEPPAEIQQWLQLRPDLP